MADRVDFYFRQRVTEAELDLACELLEQADRLCILDKGVTSSQGTPDELRARMQRPG